eukprot:IDg1722t1
MRLQCGAISLIVKQHNAKANAFFYFFGQAPKCERRVLENSAQNSVDFLMDRGTGTKNAMKCTMSQVSAGGRRGFSGEGKPPSDDSIRNMNETAVCTYTGKVLNVFSGVNSHHSGYRRQRGGKRNKQITAVRAISASGCCEPPLFIVSGKNIIRSSFTFLSAEEAAYYSHLQHLAWSDWIPDAAAILMSDNRSNEKSFIKIVIQHINLHVDASIPYCLILDGCKFRLSAEWLQFCVEIPMSLRLPQYYYRNDLSEFYRIPTVAKDSDGEGAATKLRKSDKAIWEDVLKVSRKDMRPTAALLEAERNRSSKQTASAERRSDALYKGKPALHLDFRDMKRRTNEKLKSRVLKIHQKEAREKQMLRIHCRKLQ